MIGISVQILEQGRGRLRREILGDAGSFLQRGTEGALMKEVAF